MTDLRLGILLWNQATDWPGFEAAAKRVDELGYDHLWAWDHLHPIFGDTEQTIFEGYTTLAAWAKVTSRARLGLLVGANPLRNPGLVAKMITTIDHASGGRAICGIGGAWFEYEHTAHGIDFGSGFGQRLDWLDEATAAIRDVLDGKHVTSAPGGRYELKDLHQLPLPVQSHLPIMIGGGGEQKTLRTVARYADMWNVMGTAETLRHKVDVFDERCAEIGRDPAEIEMTVGCKVFIRDSEADARRLFEEAMRLNRTPLSDVEDDPTFWIGTPEQVAAKLIEARELGFETAICEVPAPYDPESLERFIGEVKPLVDAA
jgi:alkanesulfonate monooxygenase SsuD/methylene tetrahydromethanopterin reductase-like flavin-dependent oxidoreductase (luciferase family)